MILVTTGTNAPAFDRLLHAVDGIGNGESLVVQYGPSSVRPRGATCVDYVSFDEFVELVKAARVVITHAGVGSILVTLMNGKWPIVVPRFARFGEHVDDHQVELARRLSDIGVVTLIEDPAELESALRGEDTSRPAPLAVRNGQLVRDLAAFLRTTVNVR